MTKLSEITESLDYVCDLSEMRKGMESKKKRRGGGGGGGKGGTVEVDLGSCMDNVQ